MRVGLVPSHGSHILRRVLGDGGRNARAGLRVCIESFSQDLRNYRDPLRGRVDLVAKAGAAPCA